MGKTSIQWTEHTINPIRARNRATGRVGHFCEKISPGCGHCYASEWNEHRLGTGVPFLPARREEVEPFLDVRKLEEVVRRRKPTRYFWCDMTDLFLDAHPSEWIDRCFAAMALSPQHTHQVLTKRADRLLAYLTTPFRIDDVSLALREMSEGTADLPAWPLPNVWLGVSVEDQQRAGERVPPLLQAPAAVRFLSCEPLLGPVDLSAWLPNRQPRHNEPWQDGVDWVIVGGESGRAARQCDVSWVRDLVGQCRGASVACFVKQLGAWPVDCLDLSDPGRTNFDLDLRDSHGGDPAEWPADLRVREFPAAKGA